MTTDPSELRPESGQVVHTDACPGPAIVRRDGTRIALLTCTACEAWTTVPRRNEWRDAPQPTGQPSPETRTEQPHGAEPQPEERKK